jgi:hypothetical protein
VYGYETWSLSLREKLRVRVAENGALRKIYGLKRDEIIRGWKKVHSEDLHNLHSPPNTVRKIM